ncbi:hypothetical protein [Nonlabens ulvanivorans]|uniref:hypothetical protein n=1 Tax=Nonlabens ulvanivorans TaxID=906888 RepID=UPI0029425DD3|nr:hypothetical protein [Nonlabens ulvanivorans]WOI21713.1 hypothetical protein R1T42_08450 [Nonlabens ulvanivorans]
MKNIFKYLLFALAIVLVSCETEQIVFNGTGNNLPLISFSQNNYELQIEIDAVGSVDIPINSSNRTNADRVFNISVNMVDTDAIAGSYSVPGTVTIPANEYNGFLTIDGTDVAGVDTNSLNLVLDLETNTDNVYGITTAVVSVFQVCPVDETLFIGDYQMTHLVFNGFGVPTFGFSKVVTLENAGGTSRAFDAAWAPDLGAFGDVTFSFNLSCNEILWSPSQDVGIGCAAGAGNVELSTSDASFGNGTYDPLNDASFTMNLVDDDTNDCNARTNVSILMTKI